MPAPGEIIQHRYQIVRLIGKGGSGAVYEAIDLRLGNAVALKQTAIHAEQTLNLLEREARLLARLRHPALPRVIDHFVDGRHQYLVMEFIDGDDLGTVLIRRNRPFDLQQVLMWADQLLGALEYLHRQNPPVLHRDIKPQNLKLTAEGDIVLLDFGLAKGGSGGHTIHRANESIFGYTPHYASLEQINNAGTEPRSDLYSLAATLYHLLTGVQPPDALTRATAVLRRMPDPLIPPRRLNAAVPDDVSAILLQALALDPNERPANAAAMRSALAKACTKADTTAPVATPVYPADANTLPAAQASGTVRHHGADAQPLLPTTSLPDASTASQSSFSALTRTTIEVRSSDANQVARRPDAMGQWMRTISVRVWTALTLGGSISRLPHPWNRYAIPMSGIVVMTLITFGMLLAIRSSHSTTAPVSTVQDTALSPPLSIAAPPDASAAPLTPPTTSEFSRTSKTRTVATTGVAAQVRPVALRITPDEAYSGNLPIALRVEGRSLDQAQSFALESPDADVIPLEIGERSTEQVMLLLNALPSSFAGVVTLTLIIDGVPQPDVAIVVRDFLERKTVAGVRREYRYMPQIGVDEAGAYTSLHAAPASASDRFAVLRNDDVVEVLRADTPGWYQVRISRSASALHIGAVGWIERWLIDDQNVPPLVFVGILGQTPTDLAVRCGTQFRSSIYGSVEDWNRQGIASAVLTITSADGRNQFTVRTRSNGTYEIGGLGCTTWIVRLIAVSDFPSFQANEVRVTNLNGGRYTAAEVRFRQRP